MTGARYCEDCDSPLLPGSARCVCGWEFRDTPRGPVRPDDVPHRWEPEIQTRIAENPAWHREQGESDRDYARRMLQIARAMRDAPGGVQRPAFALPLTGGGVACVRPTSRDTDTDDGGALL